MSDKMRKMGRRDFLRLVAGAGLASLPLATAGCFGLERGSSQEKTPAPSPVPSASITRSPAPAPTATARPANSAAAAATATPAPLSGNRNVFAWLRMMENDNLPTSEQDYMDHQDKIHVAIPLNGGVLMADGSWEQEQHKMESSWARQLGQIARDAGQLYMPAMGNDRDGIRAVLADTSLQTQAAERLVELAKSGRFDSPWDGVYLDIEGVPFSLRTQMTGFYHRLANAVKDAGLLLGISVGGVTQATTGSDDLDDGTDLGVASELGDVVDVRLYDYAGDPPVSVGPLWWARDCLDYALKKGARRTQLIASLAIYAQYWPSPDADYQQIPVEQAHQMVKDGGATVEWVERNANRDVYESYAALGDGYIWIEDAQTYGKRLDMVAEYNLLGHAMFTPGLGTPDHWKAVEAWQARK